MLKDDLLKLGHAFWQFEIAGVPLAHRKARGKIGRREGEFWLKIWGERLLLCVADAPDKVFAVVMPCAGEAGLAEFWRAAVKRGDWGEMSEISYHMGQRARFVTLRGNGSRSWARDWCGGDWLEFTGPKFPADLPVTSLPVTSLPVTSLPVTSLPVTSLAASEHEAMLNLWNCPFPRRSGAGKPPFGCMVRLSNGRASHKPARLYTSEKSPPIITAWQSSLRFTPTIIFRSCSVRPELYGWP